MKVIREQTKHFVQISMCITPRKKMQYERHCAVSVSLGAIVLICCYTVKRPTLCFHERFLLRPGRGTHSTACSLCLARELCREHVSLWKTMTASQHYTTVSQSNTTVPRPPPSTNLAARLPTRKRDQGEANQSHSRRRHVYHGACPGSSVDMRINQSEETTRGAQELCESRGGRPGLTSLINLRFLWT